MYSPYFLQALYENTPVPGAPYLLACALSFWAFLHCFELPPEPEFVVAKHSANFASDSEDDCESSALLSVARGSGDTANSAKQESVEVAPDSTDFRL
jgi:hypothetical protein